VAGPVVVFEDAQPGIGSTRGREPFYELAVRSRCEPGAPGLDCGAKVEKLVVANGGEPGDLAFVVLDYINVDVRIRDLRFPSRLDRVRGNG
jgi:hypothetical protein